MDAGCHQLTASHVRQRHFYDSDIPVCQYYEQFDTNGRDVPLPLGIYDLVKYFDIFIGILHIPSLNIKIIMETQPY